MTADSQNKQFFDAANNSAFPRPYSTDTARGTLEYAEAGLTARQYAAIKLRVPDSGDEWLDAMIRTSLRDYFAIHALESIIIHASNNAMVSIPCLSSGGLIDRSDFTKIAYQYADAMLAERAK